MGIKEGVGFDYYVMGLGLGSGVGAVGGVGWARGRGGGEVKLSLERGVRKFGGEFWFVASSHKRAVYLI